MSAVSCAPAPEEEDERIDTLVRFGRYLIDNHEHLLQMCDLIGNGNQTLRADLRDMVEVSWV